MKLPRWPKKVLILCLIPLVQAYHVFDTNCSVPSTLSNYVSSPNTRGTLDILWSSLFTISACTWTLQHPNVPEQRDGRDPGLLGDIKWGLRGFYKSTVRMFWTIIAPELIITVAYRDLALAHADHKEMQKWVRDSKFPWTLTHSHYANMGGFVLRGRDKPAGEVQYHDPYHLNSQGICALLEGEYISELPKMTEAEIKDKSKGDIFVKIIAVGQIVWSVVQIIGRAIKRLPVSPLEVAVVAFAVCAVFIYGLYWYKPQRVGIATTIQLNRTGLTEAGTISDAVLDALRKAQDIDRLLTDFSLLGGPIRMDSNRTTDNEVELVATGLGAAIFGGIHAAAWNFAFPSRVELILWRCASIYTAAAPLYTLLMLCMYAELDLDDRLECVFGGILTGVLVINFFLPILLYIIARGFILVEMFRTLCFLPPGSYVSTWTSNIPHVA